MATNPPPFVKSNYERLAHDDYQTIDPRCTDSFLAHFKPDTPIIDICSPMGSGIIDRLRERRFNAFVVEDAFVDELLPGAWVVTNPPYTRPLVDEIIMRTIKRVDLGEIAGAAFLLRSYFDHAKGRHHPGKYPMFSYHCYYGQIRMTFRPWWSDERSAQPIHNYVWHIWTHPNSVHHTPFVLYANGDVV